MTQQNGLFPINNAWSLTTACPPNLPPPGEYNWNYDKYLYDEPPSYDNCDNFAACGSTYFQQPCRRRAIRPRSWFGRQIGPPESATTYNCSFYKKSYSKRCPIWPRNQLQRSYASPPRCTMNQLSYTYRLKHNMWY
ncbi:uncharacterized protein LOC126759660 [Bactrocera neohumeralis]|uniref:uncharacterized protein LOC126759660 n=1 Tax=Bactrocera neohumeralis TaxID=98809 RepID=UPI0021652939|nr:uncharacterized protein LOC126759660 [Bactrocera neohumeralis]